MKLLFIDCCLRGEKSRTLRLCKAFLERRYAQSEDLQLETLSLSETPFPTVDNDLLNFRDKLIKQGCFDEPVFAPARQFAEADEIVIGAPYWDLSFPAQLKAYIENIMVSGIAFKYTERGSLGLCRAIRLTYITTSGGFFAAQNLGCDYIKAIADMLGIKEVSFITAEGLDIDPAKADTIIEKAVENISAGF